MVISLRSSFCIRSCCGALNSALKSAVFCGHGLYFVFEIYFENKLFVWFMYVLQFYMFLFVVI